MRLPDEDDEQGGMGLPLIYMIVGVSAFILIILAVVLFSNGSTSNNRQRIQNQAAATATPEAVPKAVAGENGYIDQLYGEQKLRVDDLDFWDMYPDENSVSANSSSKEVLPEQPIATPTPSPKEDLDPAEDGKHTLVTRRDGSEDWVLINPYLAQNTYDLEKLIRKNDRLGYYDGQKLTSYFGVDISKYNGTVNFEQLKKAGADFVMIRVGSRGYSSGQILPDENFVTNIQAANEADLDVGVYFFSQAITAEEAAEEAAFVIQNIAEYKITYPVVFDMEYIDNDTARIDKIKKDEKTNIAITFLSTIKTAGYIPMIYGTKEWLIEQIDLTKLMSYDIWLSQQADLPDYPYKYQMWQYTLKGEISGITGAVDFNISFVNYAAK